MFVGHRGGVGEGGGEVGRDHVGVGAILGRRVGDTQHRAAGSADKLVLHAARLASGRGFSDDLGPRRANTLAALRSLGGVSRIELLVHG